MLEKRYFLVSTGIKYFDPIIVSSQDQTIRVVHTTHFNTNEESYYDYHTKFHVEYYFSAGGWIGCDQEMIIPEESLLFDDPSYVVEIYLSDTPDSLPAGFTYAHPAVQNGMF